MPESLNLLVPANLKVRLLEIAASVGALAPTGPRRGQPSISTLIKMIAAGDILLRRRKPTSLE